jgi:predicted RNase H-like HicB family nuclease
MKPQADFPRLIPRADSMTRNLTAIIQAEDGGFVALCPQLDVCSQGGTVEEARANLREALELFFETASPDEVSRRLSNEVYVTQLEVAVG